MEVIDRAVKHMEKVSFREKRQPSITQEIIDGFLDSILLLKKQLTEQIEEISELTEMVESLTWIDDPISESDLFKIHDLITKINDYTSSLYRQLFTLKSVKDKGIATKEINAFRDEIDSFREVSQDLESVFFFLPAIEDFKEAEKIISLI